MPTPDPIPPAPEGYSTAETAALDRARSDGGTRAAIARAMWQRDYQPGPEAQIGGYVYEVADRVADADLIGAPFLTEGAPWCGSAAAIHISWDSWVVAEVNCHHGVFKGVSDPINLSKALDRAVTAWRAADHPNWCLADFEATGDTHTFMADCQRWAAHDGDHGFPEDTDD